MIRSVLTMKTIRIIAATFVVCFGLRDLGRLAAGRFGDGRTGPSRHLARCAGLGTILSSVAARYQLVLDRHPSGDQEPPARAGDWKLDNAVRAQPMTRSRPERKAETRLAAKSAQAHPRGRGQRRTRALIHLHGNLANG